MKISLLINIKMPTIVAFSDLMAEKISCSAELSMKKVSELGSEFYKDMSGSHFGIILGYCCCYRDGS